MNKSQLIALGVTMLTVLELVVLRLLWAGSHLALRSSERKSCGER